MGTDTSGKTDPQVVICGSFRRNPEALRAERDELIEHGCRVLSPRDLEFIDEMRGFVLAEHEIGRPPEEIEAGHLRAMQEADFVWLHAPDGYVGRSAAMELGFAHALGLRVYAAEQPTDLTLATMVVVVGSAARAVERLGRDRPDAPSRSLASLQTYYRRVADARGWASEGAQESLLLLTEEVGELARALRKGSARASGSGDDGHGAAQELADVQLYVVHLANVLGVDLAAAVVAKEHVNHNRFGPAERAVAA